MRSFLKQLQKGIVDLIYPPLCLHCREHLRTNQPVFCQPCLDLLVPIDPQGRCPYCFTDDFSSQKDKCCLSCRQKSHFIDRIGAVFDYEGPAASLVRHLKYGGQAYLAQAAGAYLAAQFVVLGWPMPDAVIPMPMAPMKRLERGYNQSALLAATLGKLIGRPVKHILKRRSGEFSQAGLDHRQRRQLNPEDFYLMDHPQLRGKCLLLVDDVMTTGTTLQCCGQVLQAVYPSCIYALTFCRAL